MVKCANGDCDEEIPKSDHVGGRKQIYCSKKCRDEVARRMWMFRKLTSQPIEPDPCLAMFPDWARGLSKGEK